MSNNKTNKEKQKKPHNSYVRFSSMAFQMFIVILLFVFAGKYLDEYFELDKPVLTAILSILGVTIALISLIRAVKSVKDE